MKAYSWGYVTVSDLLNILANCVCVCACVWRVCVCGVCVCVCVCVWICPTFVGDVTCDVICSLLAHSGSELFISFFKSRRNATFGLI